MLGYMMGVLDGLPILRRWWRCGRDFEGTTRLDIVEVLKGSLSTDWFVADVAVFDGVNC